MLFNCWLNGYRTSSSKIIYCSGFPILAIYLSAASIVWYTASTQLFVFSYKSITIYTFISFYGIVPTAKAPFGASNGSKHQTLAVGGLPKPKLGQVAGLDPAIPPAWGGVFTSFTTLAASLSTVATVYSEYFKFPIGAECAALHYKPLSRRTSPASLISQNPPSEFTTGVKCSIAADT